MPVTFHIPGALLEFTAGRRQVEIEDSPSTLGDALAALWKLYPGVRDRIATEQGQVRQHINIFVGSENVRYTGGLASPIPPGSEISIVPAVSGGCTPGWRFDPQTTRDKCAPLTSSPYAAYEQHWEFPSPWYRQSPG